MFALFAIVSQFWIWTILIAFKKYSVLKKTPGRSQFITTRFILTGEIDPITLIIHFPNVYNLFRNLAEFNKTKNERYEMLEYKLALKERLIDSLEMGCYSLTLILVIIKIIALEFVVLCKRFRLFILELFLIARVGVKSFNLDFILMQSIGFNAILGSLILILYLKTNNLILHTVTTPILDTSLWVLMIASSMFFLRFQV